MQRQKSLLHIRGLVVMSFLLTATTKVYLQNSELFLINLDSIFEYSVINKIQEEVYNDYHGKYEDIFTASLDSLQSDWSFCAARAGHTTIVKCRDEEIRKRVEGLKAFAHSVTSIKQIVDCSFREYVIDSVVKEFALDRYPSSLILDSSKLKIIAIANSSKIFLTDRVITFLEDRIQADKPFAEMLDRIDQEIIDLMRPVTLLGTDD